MVQSSTNKRSVLPRGNTIWVMATDTNIANVSPAVVDVTKSDIPASQRDAKKAAAMAKMSQPKKPTTNGIRRMPIGDGETASSKIEVLGDKLVKASFSFKLERDSKLRYGHTMVLDYSNCSDADILIDASRSHVITVQRKLREMGDGALDANVFTKVDVKRDLVETTRSTMDGETRDLHAFARAAKLTPDMARKFLAQIADGTLKLK